MFNGCVENRLTRFVRSALRSSLRMKLATRTLWDPLPIEWRVPCKIRTRSSFDFQNPGADCLYFTDSTLLEGDIITKVPRRAWCLSQAACLPEGLANVVEES